jgi:GntR family transcriptional regulator / MocR family aminotransferase
MLYYERRSALVEAVRQELGEGFEILGSEAGMHLVITLPPGFSDREISLRAAKESLWLWPLSTTYLEEERRRQGVILGFGSAKASEMAQEVRRLKVLLFGS